MTRFCFQSLTYLPKTFRPLAIGLASAALGLLPLPALSEGLTDHPFQPIETLRTIDRAALSSLPDPSFGLNPLLLTNEDPRLKIEEKFAVGKRGGSRKEVTASTHRRQASSTQAQASTRPRNYGLLNQTATSAVRPHPSVNGVAGDNQTAHGQVRKTRKVKRLRSIRVDEDGLLPIPGGEPKDFKPFASLQPKANPLILTAERPSPLIDLSLNESQQTSWRLWSTGFFALAEDDFTTTSSGLRLTEQRQVGGASTGFEVKPEPNFSIVVGTSFSASETSSDASAVGTALSAGLMEQVSYRDGAFELKGQASQHFVLQKLSSEISLDPNTADTEVSSYLLSGRTEGIYAIKGGKDYLIRGLLGTELRYSALEAFQDHTGNQVNRFEASHQIEAFNDIGLAISYLDLDSAIPFQIATTAKGLVQWAGREDQVSYNTESVAGVTVKGETKPALGYQLEPSLAFFLSDKARLSARYMGRFQGGRHHSGYLDFSLGF